ncbi:MAG: hypothetical protein ACSLE3_04825, partial [Microbacteriaceae bacterium]
SEGLANSGGRLFQPFVHSVIKRPLCQQDAPTIQPRLIMHMHVPVDLAIIGLGRRSLPEDVPYQPAFLDTWTLLS